MKWIVFAVALTGLIPLANWLRQNPNYTWKAWVVFGFIQYGLNPQISFIDWAGWPGYVYGLQFTGIDLLALAFLMILPRSRHSLPFLFVMGLYFLSAVLSVFHAQVPMAAVFYVWQLARAFLVYVVVTRASTDERVPYAILTGMTFGLCYQAGLAIWQRFGLGILQTGASFGDKNLLGLASEFAVFPMFALLLAGKRGWQTIVAPLAGLLIAILTTSRAAVGLAAIGLVMVFVLSSMRGWSSRKMRVFISGVVVVALLSPLAISSFEKRFSEKPLPAMMNALLFENAASLILLDHPFGVGANNYVVAANTGGYQDAAGVPWGGGQRNTIVHSIYWLIAAETGYFGLFAFALLLIRIAPVPFLCSWRNKRDIRGDYLLGLGVTLIVVIIHCAYEWVFMFYHVQYLFATTVGMIAGLATQLGYWRNRRTLPQPELVPEKVIGPISYLHGKGPK